MKLILENVRGFAGLHEIPIRQITVLIGENSSGKSTILAAMAAALQPDFPTTENPFNRAPFELGSFDTIATFRGGKFGRSQNFSIGWEGDQKAGNPSIKATFSSSQGTPRLTKIQIKQKTQTLTGDLKSSQWEYTESDHKAPIKFKLGTDGADRFQIHDLPRLIVDQIAGANKIHKRLTREDDRVIRAIFDLVYGHRQVRPRVTALAPLRSRPHKTYDELIEEFKPEGDHIPLVLSRLFSSDDEESKKTIEALNRFGVSSGLFKEIKVKRMGRQSSDPFQIRIKAAGPDANLVDVGYGVSQALPIVVDPLLAAKGRIVLVQQPEVHLHPKAQAALGTFFVEISKQRDQRFVIETHSDFLVDRIRMAVADKIIAPDDVQLVFLERKGINVKAHSLRLDDMGNVTNAPTTYRSFFLEEELNLLTRGN